MKPELRVFADVSQLNHHAAESFVKIINEGIQRSGRASVALAGGSTPRAVYELLASDFRNAVPWAQVHWFWSDERYVPHTDAKSNFQMAKEALLDRLNASAATIHAMPTADAAPADAARKYEETLRSFFDGTIPRFDLTLLGIGNDGHTASLFPITPALGETTHWVVPNQAPVAPRQRLTLTFPVLNNSAEVHFLVTGASKAPALQQILSGAADLSIYPAAAVKPTSGNVIWWLDAQAAALIDKS